MKRESVALRVHSQSSWRPERADVAPEVLKQPVGRTLSCSVEVALVLIWPLFDWRRPIHIMEDNLLYSKSIYLNVNLISKYFKEKCRIMFSQISV